MRRKLLAVVVCLFLGGTSANAQQTVDLFQMKLSDRAELVLEAMKEATTAVLRVKDKQTAEVAKAVLESVDKRIKQYSERTTERTPEERRWVADIFLPKKEAQQSELEKAYDKVIGVDPNLLPQFLDSAKLKEYRGKTIGRARFMAKNIQVAVKSYRVSTDKDWPKSLDVLLAHGNEKPWIEGEKEGLKDPWGKEFKRLRIEKDRAGFEIPVISTINPFGDGKEEIRWPEKGK